MLIQVIHCHPLTDSYNHALFRTVVAALADRGHEVVATDLYREGFEPAMRGEERRSYCACLLYTSPSPRDGLLSRMPSSA